MPSISAAASAPGVPAPRAAALPWYVPAVLVAATCAVVGVIWDISWHRTIGRDTFWTPAHLAIYASGIIAGLSCGWLVLKTTFAGSDAERAAGVRFWGFRGPLGAWLCIWGAMAMIVSAPFDNWWHNAYGLDVKVLSLPHLILALGFTGIQLGAVLMVAALQNRAGGEARYGRLLAYGIGILVLNVAILGFEQIGFSQNAHNALYYLVCAAIFPILLVAGARASSLRWPATTAAVVYVGVTLIMVWVLPLFPATPKLAPVYRPLTHMVPPPFPLLLIVPAVAVDLVMRRFGTGRDWRLSALVGVSFLAVLLVTQWFATIYLISPASESFLFGAQRWNYNSLPGDFEHQFWDIRSDPVTPLKLGFAALLAMTSSRVGLWLGNGLARVQR
ncbi:MAG: hypothetical protein DMD37_09340 [Gemmatimonadetes bacterium]|nr:MAG: hypothetical protein DMD71_11045 [Gemmatimonadota bacterium]PYO86103.1 MAG: hypothetical protein DMD68_01270 [Gemmatimonadota bacterium]PYP62600.1 MAG: hypothetical protein DMD37_09340 [Gemmatimonadota bacterium]